MKKTKIELKNQKVINDMMSPVEREKHILMTVIYKLMNKYLKIDSKEIDKMIKEEINLNKKLYNIIIRKTRTCRLHIFKSKELTRYWNRIKCIYTY